MMAAKTTTQTTNPISFLPLTKEEEKNYVEKLSVLFHSSTHRMEEKAWLEHIDNGNQTLSKILQISANLYRYLLAMEASTTGGTPEHADAAPAKYSIPFFLLYRPNENNYILLMVMFGYCRSVYRVCFKQLEEMKKKIVLDQMHQEVTIMHELHCEELYKRQVKTRNPQPFTSTSIFTFLLNDHNPQTSSLPNSWDIRHHDKLLKSYLQNLRECYRLIQPIFDLFLLLYPHLQLSFKHLQKCCANIQVLNEIFMSLKNNDKIFSYPTILEVLKEIA